MINDILISYFKEKGSVIIPRKGVFIKVKDHKSGEEKTAFIYNPSIDYSEITAYIKTALEVDDAAANTIIEGFCALMDSHLKNKSEYEIEGIATLCTDHKWGVYMATEETAVKPTIKTTITETVTSSIVDKPMPEKRLDAILAETPHRKVEVAAPVTLADKYIKHTDHATNIDEVVEEVKEIVLEAENTVEPKTEGPACELKETDRRDKLNEIFASKRDSSAELSDKLNELYKTKKEEPAPVTTPSVAIPTPEPVKAEQPKAEPYVVPKKKGIDKSMVFFIISILLFLCALGYYFITKNDIDMQMPGGQDSVLTEQIEVIE